MMPDSSPSRVYAFLKDLLPFFKNSVYSLQGSRPSIMPDLSPSPVYAFLKLPLLFLKNSVHTSSPDRVYTPLYRKPFAILKITYTRQAPKCLISVLLSYTLFSNFPFSSSKIAYTLPRHACVYAPMKKALHYLENSVYSARNCKVLRYLTPALLAYTLL